MSRHESSPELGLRPPLHVRELTSYGSRSRSVLATDPNGFIDARSGSLGLWVAGCRLLSRYEWHVAGERPRAAGAAWTSQHRWHGYFIAAPPELRRREKPVDPQEQALELHLSRRIGAGLHEDAELVNHTQERTRCTLELAFATDFASLGEESGEHAESGRVQRRWQRLGDGRFHLLVEYRAEHAYVHQGDAGVAVFERALELWVQTSGSRVEHRDGLIRFEVELEPRQRFRACLNFRPHGDHVPRDAPVECASTGEEDTWERRTRAFLDRSASFRHESPPELAAVVVKTATVAKRDLASLRLFDLDEPNGWVPAAGAPKYIGLFGRDTVIAASQALLLGPELALGALERVGRLRATRTDDWRDAQPGRLIHELHTDPASELRFGPHGRYYGDVTVSLAYALLLNRYWRWTGDRRTVERFAGVARDALAWADRELLVGDVPFYRYQTRSEQGESNQGWKDSELAMVHADGSQARAPIGTCEMQALVYAAKRALAEMLGVLGQGSEASRLRETADELKRRFNATFWLEDERTYAMAVDADGQLLRSVASGPAHCLAHGIVDEALAAACTERLLTDDLFSGWGLRTLSSRHPAYNPFAYHRGTLWPMETAELAAGCARYGLFDQLFTTCRAAFELASLFEQTRLPELLAGHARDSEHPFPGLYPEANAPQAWSAAAVMRLLESLLGLEPYAARSVLFVDPHLPDWLPDFTLERLRVGDATVTLRFRRAADGHVEHEVLARDGKLSVCRAERMGARLQTADAPDAVAESAAAER